MSKDEGEEKMMFEKSCGCIIINDNKVLLINDTNGNWGFPKGHVEENETDIETAIRETKEEVNLDVEVDENRKYTIKYKTDRDTLKTVVYFVAKIKGGEIKPQIGEVNEIKWLDFNEAMQKITYENVKEVFRKIIINS